MELIRRHSSFWGCEVVFILESCEIVNDWTLRVLKTAKKIISNEKLVRGKRARVVWRLVFISVPL